VPSAAPRRSWSTSRRPRSSTVVAILLEGLASCEKLERPLLLLLPDDSAPEVHRLFELTGLASLLPVVRSWDEAATRALS